MESDIYVNNTLVNNTLVNNTLVNNTLVNNTLVNNTLVNNISVNDIPDEVLIEILLYLPADDFHNIKLLSHRFYSIFWDTHVQKRVDSKRYWRRVREYFYKAPNGKMYGMLDMYMCDINARKKVAYSNGSRHGIQEVEGIHVSIYTDWDSGKKLNEMLIKNGRILARVDWS